MDQMFMNFYFGIQHLQVGASKLLQLYHLDRVSFIHIFDLNPLKHLAAVTFTKYFVSGIFVNAYLNFRLFQCI